jgi:LPXTG-motif cell wall-anchored protein
MSELQGPRIPGEERSGRRRPLGWIIGRLIALLLLAFLIPFACQALRGGSDPQREGSGAQGERTGAQDAAGAGGETTAGETTRPESAQAGGRQTGESATNTNRAAGNGPEKISGEQAAVQGRERLPESGGISPAALLAVGTVLLLMGSAGFFVVMRRRSANGG